MQLALLLALVAAFLIVPSHQYAITYCLNGGILHCGACKCPQGYAGPICETDINECASNPCKNGGNCIDKVNGYVCHCCNGFTGPNCEQGGPCASHPCAHGLCIPTANYYGYICHCYDGFYGERCNLYKTGGYSRSGSGSTKSSKGSKKSGSGKSGSGSKKSDFKKASKFFKDVYGSHYKSKLKKYVSKYLKSGSVSRSKRSSQYYREFGSRFNPSDWRFMKRIYGDYYARELKNYYLRKAGYW